MRVSDILGHKGGRVVTIRPDATVSTAVHRLALERIGALVVSEDGRHVAGIISIGDVVNNRLHEVELEANVLREAYIAAH